MSSYLQSLTFATESRSLITPLLLLSTSLSISLGLLHRTYLLLLSFEHQIGYTDTVLHIREGFMHLTAASFLLYALVLL